MATERDASPGPAASEGQNPDARLRLAVLGDSIIVHDGLWLPAALAALHGRFVLPEGFNRAIGGATTQVVLERIDEAVALSPDVLILHAGTNDLVTTLDPADAIYERIATACARGLAGGIGHVLVGCVLPRQDAYWQRCRMRHPQRTRLNGLLRRLPGDPRVAAFPGRVVILDLERASPKWMPVRRESARQNKGLEPYSIATRSDTAPERRFDPRRDTDDGLHPNAAGGHRLGRAIGRELARIEARIAAREVARRGGGGLAGRLRALAAALSHRIRFMSRRASPASAARRRS